MDAADARHDVGLAKGQCQHVVKVKIGFGPTLRPIGAICVKLPSIAAAAAALPPGPSSGSSADSPAGVASARPREAVRHTRGWALLRLGTLSRSSGAHRSCAMVLSAPACKAGLFGSPREVSS